MIIPRPPLFIVEGDDVIVFDSLEKLMRFMEPIDVVNREGRIYDSEGRQLHFKPGTSKGFFGFGRHEIILFNGVEIEPRHSEELTWKLTGFLALKGAGQDSLSRASLKELANKALDYKTN